VDDFAAFSAHLRRTFLCMASRPALERSALDLCKARQKETRARFRWWISVDTVAYRLKKPAGQLHDAIYYAKMNGWLNTGGVPVHSLVLEQEGRMATARADARSRIRSGGARATRARRGQQRTGSEAGSQRA
jgi:hypothetical protein